MFRQPDLILTYHSIYSVVPGDLQNWIHNVTPDEFYRQMRWCRANFDMVDLDSLAGGQSWGREGQIAVTFDDGNETAFSTALPILAELGIPATLFLTGDSLDGFPGWRDKIRLILTRGWRAEFSAFAHPFLRPEDLREDGVFFRATKSQACHSGRLDALLDGFLARRGGYLDLLQARHRIPADGLPLHPLIRYGNHSARHYMLASLLETDQEREIAGLHHRLEAMTLDPIHWFAVPFGRPGDLGAYGLQALEKLGYRGCLWNGGSMASEALPAHHPDRPPGGRELIALGRKKAPATLELLIRDLVLDRTGTGRRRVQMANWRRPEVRSIA